jgi:hypothetical protein
MERLRPNELPPYLTLSRAHFEAFKRDKPERGPNAVSPIVLAATLLALWKQTLDGTPAMVTDAQVLLDKIEVREWNAGRALTNCDWLVLADDEIGIRPERMLKALALAKSYCVASPA